MSEDSNNNDRRTEHVVTKNNEITPRLKRVVRQKGIPTESDWIVLVPTYLKELVTIKLPVRSDSTQA